MELSNFKRKKGTNWAFVAVVASLAFYCYSSFASSRQAAAPTPNATGETTAPAGEPSATPGAARGVARVGFRQRPVEDFNDNTGWTSMFNGHDLSEWDGDKQIWKVKDGAIYAESTCVLPTGRLPKA